LLYGSDANILAQKVKMLSCKNIVNSNICFIIMLEQCLL